MRPFTQTLHALHAHEAMTVILLAAAAAIAVAIWIAVVNFREECARSGPRESCRPPNDRRTRR